MFVCIHVCNLCACARMCVFLSANTTHFVSLLIFSLLVLLERQLWQRTAQDMLTIMLFASVPGNSGRRR